MDTVIDSSHKKSHFSKSEVVKDPQKSFEQEYLWELVK
jgi:hypothetical protein